jgi:hypothetical protein
MVVTGGVSFFEPESATCPTPLSKVTEVALVELQVSVVDELRMIEVGCAVRVNVGAGCGPGVGCESFDFTPEQAVKVTTSSRVTAGRNISESNSLERTWLSNRDVSGSMRDGAG